MRAIPNTIKLIILILAIGLIYISLAIHYKFFPYHSLRHLYHTYTNPDHEPWSIGIYKGKTPFHLKPSIDPDGPVLTARDVSDINAVFVADPFFIEESGSYYMFFEVLNRINSQGDIAYAKSDDLINWKYQKVIINESFHISYPLVFKWENQYYMVPESMEDQSIRLYKAISFPNEWEYLGNLLEGDNFTNPTIFRYNNKWWMYVNLHREDNLYLYSSDNLEYGWNQHPKSPVMTDNKHHSQNAGRVLLDDGQIYRFAQDCYPYYGMQVYGIQVHELSDSTYKERLVDDLPIIKKSGEGWNAKGMHHIDLLKINKEWVAVVDGQK